MVIMALVRATGCTYEEAQMETWEAHTFGKAPVHFASKQECDSAATIIASIGVKTEVAPEWND
jgi:ATP-dependent Clp protease adaptor protein ClpS